MRISFSYLSMFSGCALSFLLQSQKDLLKSPSTDLLRLSSMARPNDDGKRSRWSQQSHPSLTNENFNWSVPGRGHVTQFTALSGQIDPPDNENAAATTRASRTDSVSQPSIPSFQWVPIDPRQSVDKSTMRNLRSHVMNNYLQKEQQNPNSTDTRVRAIGPYRKRKRGSPPSTSSLPQPGSTKTRSVPSSGDKATSKSIITGSEEEEDLHHAAGQLDLVLAYRSESDTRRRGASKSIHAANLVPETNLNLEHRVPWDISWPRLHPFLDRRLSHNPFRVSPRFENPEIDVDSLKRTCMCLHLDSYAVCPLILHRYQFLRKPCHTEELATNGCTDPPHFSEQSLCIHSISGCDAIGRIPDETTEINTTCSNSSSV